ncbi:MAG TPA: DedA family protein [Candidatus Binatia bacterium]
MLHSFFVQWFQLSREWGYTGVFLLMALESTVFPIPSEVVLPPAAYWAQQGEFSFWSIVVAGTLGSWFGSTISYFVAKAVGRPLILRYGKYVFVPEKKWLLAEQWVQAYSAAGIFFARLLPVVRHLISLPAGATRVPYATFSTMTLAGSFLWSLVLAWFGAEVLSSQPNLLGDPDALRMVLKQKLMWFIGAAVAFLAAYVLVELLGRRLRRQARVV